MTGISLGNPEISAIAIGDTEIENVSLGDTLIWSATPPPPLTYNVESAEWSTDPDIVTGTPWTGSTAVGVPQYLGYQGNARSGSNERYVFGGPGTADEDQKRYAYMGAWMHGATIENTDATDDLLIVEWIRGTDGWRETTITPGNTYTIDLTNRTLNAGTGGTAAADLDCVFIESNSIISGSCSITGYSMQCLPLSTSTPTNIYQGILVTPGDTLINITIDGPYDDYEVRLDGGAWETVTGNTHQFTGLTNDQQYQIEGRIRAQTHQTVSVAAGPIFTAFGTPTAAGFDPITGISWNAVFWADQPGGTPPADGEIVTFDPADGVGGTWNRRDTIRWRTNMGGTGKPAFVMPDTGSNNNGPMIHKTPAWSGDGVYAFIVGKGTGGSADIMDGQVNNPGAGRFLLQQSGGNWMIFSGQSQTGGISDDNVHTFLVRFLGTAGADRLAVDGVEIINGDAGSHSFAGIGAGSTPSNSAHTGCEIAFFGMKDSDFTAQEISDLQAWAETTYGL